jgi:hypothetical protein
MLKQRLNLIGTELVGPDRQETYERR